MSENKNLPQTFSIENFNVNALEEVKNKREAQLKIVEDNPYTEITDTETYTTAKKHRTAYVTARTSLTKEKKVVIDKVKEKITKPISDLYDEFIDITKPHEEKQQKEVTRWEDIKENERLAKLQIEEDRKQAHRDNIKTIATTVSEEIKNLDYNASLTYEVKPLLNGEEVSPDSFEEFKGDLLGELESLKFLLSSKKDTLKEQEDLRVERERLENERKENERISGHKQAIQDYYNCWINRIYSVTFENFKALKSFFNKESPIRVDEFQKEYAAKRAELVKEFEQRETLLNNQEQQRIELEKQRQKQEAEAKRIAEENAKKQAEIEATQKAEQERIQAENKRLEEEKQALQKEKDELLKSQRIQTLKNLGFDDDLVLDTENVKIILEESQLLCSEEEFTTFIQETEERLAFVPPGLEGVPTKTTFTETKHFSICSIKRIEDDIQEAEYEEPSLMHLESIQDGNLNLVMLNDYQEEMQTLLNDFCDYCLSKHGHIDQEFIVEFLTRE
ncbi:hypothetical protein [Myroides odoratus]|uniref:Cell envelope integrity protein TolA n=1 Tax=Myroides odoratus TaxID=256 RepID=A0A9Q7E7T5_MYROD|nr:hypothetical protein [Myroides odoratus]EHQ41496.1 hypothetical protein Myrod_0660 [Myroides odoratus DSM 2801]EKB02711.1 hypothetical protein HMPREF9716_03740 [Myroides odoratus CIP 103059]QQT98922.1 cell envelope integrity protein TolA [Myroides odoratus]WQD58893.1 cell envelope integrity protein TolA [Myroides odoratus]STZ28759.1 Uncharacterised protein [Myroides odoratus]